jgi:hypothetical protein
MILRGGANRALDDLSAVLVNATNDGVGALLASTSKVTMNRVFFIDEGRFSSARCRKRSTKCIAPERRATLHTSLPMHDQHLDRLRIERQPPLLTCLGFLLKDPSLRLSIAPLYGQQPTIQVDMLPAQSAHLAAPRPRDHRQPQEQAPLGID